MISLEQFKDMYNTFNGTYTKDENDVNYWIHWYLNKPNICNVVELNDAKYNVSTLEMFYKMLKQETNCLNISTK